MLDNVEGGDRIVIIDSNKDLPENWREQLNVMEGNVKLDEKWESFLDKREQEISDSENAKEDEDVNNVEDVEDNNREDNNIDGGEHVENNNSNENISSNLPKRVLIFTTTFHGSSISVFC